MGSRGWVKLHRKIQDHWIYQEKRIFSRYEAWLDLIMLANHKDNKSLIDGELITVKKGSFITSKRRLCGRWDWSNTKVDNFLKLLEQDEMITYESDTKKTVITIANYDVYHDKDIEKRHGNDTDVSENAPTQVADGFEIDEKGDTKKTGLPHDTEGVSGGVEFEKRHESDTETKQKHNGNDTETHKQECKELKELKELKDSTTTENDDAIVFYQNNIGMIRPNITDEMLDYIKDLGDPLVIEALKRSLDRNKPSWGYAKSILRSWYSKGIRTIDQAKAEEIEFKNQRSNQRPSHSKKPKQQEVIPDWFKNRNNNASDSQQIENEEKEAQELDALLKNYRKAGGNE